MTEQNKQSDTPAPAQHSVGSEGAHLAEINAALKTINDTCAALQYDDRGRYGVETIGPLRSVAKLINKLVFMQINERAATLEEAAKIADAGASNAASMKDRKAATSLGGTAVLTGYIFAETEAVSIARQIRALATTEGQP
jgi:hypothetical protein